MLGCSAPCQQEKRCSRPSTQAAAHACPNAAMHGALWLWPAIKENGELHTMRGWKPNTMHQQTHPASGSWGKQFPPAALEENRHTHRRPEMHTASQTNCHPRAAQHTSTAAPNSATAHHAQTPTLRTRRLVVPLVQKRATFQPVGPSCTLTPPQVKQAQPATHAHVREQVPVHCTCAGLCSKKDGELNSLGTRRRCVTVTVHQRGPAAAVQRTIQATAHQGDQLHNLPCRRVLSTCSWCGPTPAPKEKKTAGLSPVPPGPC